MIRQRIIVVFLVALAFALGPICVAGEEKIELEWWWWQDQPVMDGWVDQSIEMYEKANPNIKIKAVLQSAWGLTPAFEAAAAAGQGADIQYVWKTDMMAHSWAGHFTPISDFFTEEEIRNWFKWGVDSVMWRGKLYGIPWNYTPCPYSYNKEIFAKAGLDPNDPKYVDGTWTWDDFVEAAEAIKALGLIPIAGGNKEGWLPGFVVSGIGLNNFDSIADYMKAITGESKFTDPQYADFWGKLEYMIKNGYFDEGVNGVEHFQGQTLFDQGKSGMSAAVLAGVLMAGKALGYEKVQVTTPPITGKGKMAGGIMILQHFLTIPSWSKHKKEAADFLRFLFTDERLAAMTEMSREIVPTKSFFENYVYPERVEITPQDSQAIRLMKRKYVPRIQSFWPPQIQADAIMRVGQLLFAGEIDAKEAAKQTQKVTEKWRLANQDYVEHTKEWMGEMATRSYDKLWWFPE